MLATDVTLQVVNVIASKNVFTIRLNVFKAESVPSSSPASWGEAGDKLGELSAVISVMRDF
jgi:hypothetical protein